MGTNVFYNMVKEYADSLIEQRPDCASGNNAICAIFTSKHDIFTGITDISQSAAEYPAINAMCDAGQTKAIQMITIMLSDFSVVKPNAGGIVKLIETDPENNKCEVFISTNESVKAVELAKEPVSAEPDNEEFFSGFDVQEDVQENETAEESEQKTEQTEQPEQKTEPVSSPVVEKAENIVSSSELGAPADFSSGFDIDVTNPFYEAPAEDKEVATIATIPSSSDNADTANAPVQSNGNSKKAPVMSKDELLKQAKKKKKIAKNIFSAKKK